MSLLHALVAAFFSGALYRDVAHRWRPGRGVALLALALAVGWAVQVTSIGRSLGAWAHGDAAAFIAALPPLVLRDGQLEASPPGPHALTLGSGDQADRVVIDTSQDPVAMTPETRIRVTRTELAVRRNALETRTFAMGSAVEMAGLEDGPVDPDVLQGVVDGFARWAPVVLYPVAVVVELLYRIAAAALLALVALPLGRLLGTRLDYGRHFVVSLVALVPLVLVASLLSAYGAPLPAWAGVVLAVGYLAFALRSAAERAPAASGPAVVGGGA
ncbi:MAG: hypothetical protein R3F35_15225 [Myxococcota bacterium]